jgi:hypothetical protein
MSKFEQAVKRAEATVYGNMIWSSGVKEMKSGQKFAIVVNKVVWYAMRIIVEIDSRTSFVNTVKICEQFFKSSIINDAENYVKELCNEVDPNLLKEKLRFWNINEWSTKGCYIVMPDSVQYEPDNYLKPGDFVMVCRKSFLGLTKLYHHAGIYVGNKKIIHVTGSGSKVKSEAYVRETDWNTFYGDEKTEVVIFCFFFKRKSPVEIVNQAKKLIGTRKNEYDILMRNCQNFASYCHIGVDFCPEMVYTRGLYVNLVKDAINVFNEIYDGKTVYYE